MRFLIALPLVCLLAAPVAHAQGFKPKTPTPVKKRLPTPFPTGSTTSGGTGMFYHPATPAWNRFPPHLLYQFSTLSVGIGPHAGHAALLLGHGMHGWTGPNRDPLWFFNERRKEERRLEELVGPWGMFGPVVPAHKPPSMQQLIRQLMHPSDEMFMFGLLEDPLFGSQRRGPFAIRGSPALLGPALLGFDLGMPPAFRSGIMSPYGAGSPLDRILRPPGLDLRGGFFQELPFGPGLGGGRFALFSNTTNTMTMFNRFAISPMHMGGSSFPSSMSGPYWRSGFGSPYQAIPRKRGQPMIGTPQSALPKPPTEEQLAFLKQFDKDLTGIVELARNKQWTKLAAPIRKVLDLPDLPTTLAGNLKRLDGMAKEIVGLQWFTEVMSEWTRRAGDSARAPHQSGIVSLAILPQVTAPLASACADQRDCRVFDVQVCVADIEAIRKVVAHIAAGKSPVKKADGVTPAAVETLLGRTLSGVETLVFLQMRADNRSAEEVVAVLRKTK